MEGIEIIDNTEEAQDTYGHWYGSSKLVLTKEMLEALLEGKCIACNDGEYATFISYEAKEH